ncbi:MAG TPA: hypothetical protein VMU00_01465 [Steroidobacteraceae bacterium]|nr:hypothetical protein [Steroidobacteraceae bacterium]
MTLSRRTVVAGLGLGALPLLAHAGALRPTPQETLGPYYPVRVPAAHDWDMTRLPGRAGRAAGQLIELSARVLRTDGTPVPHARVEVWQANAAGRYSHPLDRNPAPLDPNFEGIALLRTDSGGRFRIRTVKPGAYPDPSGGERTPHIHFDVQADDYRLVTQMYFPGEALNATDILLSTMAARHRDPGLAMAHALEARTEGVQAYAWEIVLLQR